MPVILAPQSFEPWLAGEDPACDLGIGEALRLTPVSPEMNSPRYNEPRCIEALAPDARFHRDSGTRSL